VKDIASPAIEQLEFMRGDKPVYVNTLPSNILRLVEEARRTGFTIEIPCIISVAEYLGPEVRKAALETFGARTIDVFSSAEGGVIAIECPDSGLYHIQSELVLVEIIREDGQACKEGEIGEVVVTPLYNYATPLLRYRSGDFVEVGPQCRCGRCLPTISRVVGRREHMFLFPDGTRRLPQIDRIAFADIVSHDKWVLVQTGRDTAELRIAGDVTRAQRAEILHLAHAALEDQFQTQLQVVEDLPLTSGSKRQLTLNAFNPSAG
jgi:phenylacetate-CoA ligase